MSGEGGISVASFPTYIWSFPNQQCDMSAQTSSNRVVLTKTLQGGPSQPPGRVREGSAKAAGVTLRSMLLIATTDKMAGACDSCARRPL